MTGLNSGRESGGAGDEKTGKSLLNHARRVEGIFGDCGARCVLTLGTLLQPLRTRLDALAWDAGILWVAVDDASTEEALPWTAPASGVDHLALLQYTSALPRAPEA